MLIITALQHIYFYNYYNFITILQLQIFFYKIAFEYFPILLLHYTIDKVNIIINMERNVRATIYHWCHTFRSKYFCYDTYTRACAVITLGISVEACERRVHYWWRVSNHLIHSLLRPYQDLCSPYVTRHILTRITCPALPSSTRAFLDNNLPSTPLTIEIDCVCGCAGR